MQQTRLQPNAATEASPDRTRLAYQTPRLVDLGDLRDVTLGASPGIGDSGGTQTQRCPGCP